MEKLLTIIVPSYNMEKYLPKCLGSLVVDDPALLERLEVIVVNDGSTDRTSEIAHDFERRHPGVFRVIDKPNGHYGSCINAALPVATGKYVRILDADDVFDVIGFVAYIRFLFDLGDVTDAIYSDFARVDESGKVVGVERYPFPRCSTFEFGNAIDGKCSLFMHAVAYRTAMLREIGYKQTEGVCYTDEEWRSIPLAGVKKAAYFPEVVYRYLVGREGQSMDAASVVKNYWVVPKLFARILAESSDRRKFRDLRVFAYLQESLFGSVRTIYHKVIFSRTVFPRMDLVAFDSLLREKHPALHRRLDTVVYCKRVPVRYIRAWRQKNAFLPLLVLVCKTYSSICYKIAKFR